MIPILLPIPLIRQREQGECLAACAAMALTYMGLSVAYARLVRVLHVKAKAGTAFSHIRELEQLGIVVVYKQGTLAELHDHLTHDRPCVVPVQTRELPYWDEATTHAVVVAGLDDAHVYLNDPALDYAPAAVTLGDFDLAWLEQDEFYAALMRRE